jgi:DNA-directed RNA polymerase specialized sigma24 family protein
MYPTQHQWALLEAYKQYPFPITPLQFLQIYDELSYRELATILGLSISSVELFSAIALLAVTGSVLQNTVAP